MLSRTVSISRLVSSDKWRADFHVHGEAEFPSSQYDLVSLANLAVQSSRAVYPKELNGDSFVYIGLENVESITGDLIGDLAGSSDTVRSRSKEFQARDVLYGRLRPYLRKAVFIEPPLDHGLCSTEFIILRAKTEIILPEFLRELLVSRPVTTRLSRMQGGAALPRVSPKDLLKLRVPVPPLDVQNAIVDEVRKLRTERQEAAAKVKALTEQGESVLVTIFG